MPGWTRGGVAVCVLLLLGASASAQERVWDAGSLATISVSGTAELEATPDLIEWHVAIVSTDTNPMAAKTHNDAQYESVLDLADDVDIDAEDIIAGPVSVERIYERGSRGERGAFKHYELRRSVVLVLRDFDEFDELLTRLAAVRVEFHMDYNATRVHAMKREARIAAVRIAREKAQEMAEALGVSVGRPLEIVEAGSRMTGFDLNNALSNTNTGGARVGGGDGVGLRQGAISVVARVEIVFELVQPE
ncbi:MAG: SIMPL domain-containing protein [Phycisphaerales bacterium JB063]